MSAQRCRRLADTEWESRKSTIRQLYLDEDKKLEGSDGVMEIMASEHHFRASKAQYETRLKKWNFRKYATHVDWQAISRQLDIRAAEGKSTHVFLRGALVKPSKVRKETQRHKVGGSARIHPQASLDPLPEYVMLKTPPTRSVALPVHSKYRNHDTDIAELLVPQDDLEQPIPLSALGYDQNYSTFPPPYTPQPFDGSSLGITPNSTLSLEHSNALTGYTDIMSEPVSTFDVMNLDSFAMSSGWQIHQTSIEPVMASNAILSSFENAVPYILPAIQQFLQKSSAAANISSMALEKACLPDTWQHLHKQSPGLQFIYFITLRLLNNQDLAALRKPKSPLDALHKAAIEYVLSLPVPELNRFLNSFRKPFTRAIEQGLVRAAVELDAFRPLEAIIRRGLNPNDISCTFQNGQCLLLLERACALFNKNSVQTLLRLGADPSKYLYFRSPLDDLLSWASSNQLAVAQEEVVDIISCLLNAGAKPSPMSLRIAVYQCVPEVLEVLVAGLLHSSTEMFIQNGGLAWILRRSDADYITSSVQSILEQEYPATIRDSSCWIEVLTASLSNATYNQHMEATQLLLRAGAQPNANCLINAVRGRNMQAIKLFLGFGIDANSSYVPEFNYSEAEYQCTALSEAVRGRFFEAFELFKRLGFMKKLAENEVGLRLTLEAAAWIGDEALIDILLAYPRSPSSHQYPSRNSFSSVITVAASLGRDSIVQKLLQTGIHPSSTALYKAVIARHSITAQLLVDLVPRICRSMSFSEKSWGEILFEAIKWGEINVVKSLLATGIRLDETFAVLDEHNDWCTSLLGAAILRKEKTIANLLIDHEAFIEVRTTCNDLYDGGYEALTALGASVRTGDFELCQSLLRHGVDPCDDWALYFATQESGAGFLEILLDAFTARYSSSSRHFGGLALQKVLKDGDLSAFSRLAAFSDANSLVCHEGTSLVCHEGTSLVCHEGTSLVGHEDTRSHLTTLGYALALWSDRNMGFLDVLLKDWKNPDVIVYEEDSVPPNRKTALLYAIEHTEGLKLVERLVKAGASVNHPAKSRIARTPLQCAAEVGKEDVVCYLLEMGADPNGSPAGHGGATALQLAAIQDHIRIANILLQHNADINAPPAVLDGRTAFEGAAEHGRIEMMLFLVEKGANLLDGKQYPRAIKFAEANGQLAAKELAKQLYDAATHNVMGAMLELSDEVPCDSLASGMGDGWPFFDQVNA